jgi:hypothetical protein
MEKSLLYRINHRITGSFFDENETIFNKRVELYVQKFPVVKTTSCGVWINVYEKKKFVNLKSFKKFAHETIEEAKIAFEKRKEKQIRILENQLKSVKIALTLSRSNEEFKEEMFFFTDEGYHD